MDDFHMRGVGVLDIKCDGVFYAIQIVVHPCS